MCEQRLQTARWSGLSGTPARGMTTGVRSTCMGPTAILVAMGVPIDSPQAWATLNSELPGLLDRLMASEIFGLEHGC